VTNVFRCFESFARLICHLFSYSLLRSISIWRWKRENIPADIASGSPIPSTWGTREAAFGSATCPIENYFNDLSMVLVGRQPV
jgi:hypothetical protein